MSRPVLFLLHALGSSARSWDHVVAALHPDFDCVALDLPGFGARAHAAGLTVEEMADWLATTIRDHAPDRWLLVGHSMGGKIATLVAARAERGEANLSGLAGVVLIAASPPAVEPIDDERRATMIGWFADGAPSEDDAKTFVEANIAAPLPAADMAVAVADVRRSGRTAWLGWLERGSLEDWSAVVGTLRTPALILAGGDDGDLGEANQRRLNLPHYPAGRIAVINGAAHLIPLEKPAEVAGAIASHWTRIAATSALLPPDMAHLVASDRVSARTRAVLMARLDDPAEDVPHALDVDQCITLAALLDRVLPQRTTTIDLASRIDSALAQGPGDGWRFADLPADADAYRQGLDTLAALTGDFAALSVTERDGWIDRIASGTAGIAGTPGRLSADQMRLWFEDVRADAVRTWLSHPAAMAQIGYDGFANGGDGRRMQGYLRTHAGEREGWELTPTENIR